MLIEPKAYGVKNAQEIISALAKLGTVINGASMPAKSYDHFWRREGRNITTADIIQIHGKDGVNRTDGNVKRDIRLTSEDAKSALEIFADRAMDRLRVLKGVGTGKPDKAKASKIATNAAASGYKEAAKHLKRTLARRVNRQEDRYGSSLEPVKSDYAKTREKKFGVSPGQVFVRTGRLAENLQGRIKLHKGGTSGIASRLSGGLF